mgnify:CR=1 FL=1
MRSGGPTRAVFLGMIHSDVLLCRGTADDLGSVNSVIEAAVMTWDLPERVKRLSMPSYRYGSHDLEHLELFVAAVARRGIIGAAAWEQADMMDAPAGLKALLLHGIYVHPDLHRSGIGTQLLRAAQRAAGEGGFDGLLVKAQRTAEAFFYRLGFERLPVANPVRDYPHRLWKPLRATDKQGGIGEHAKSLATI